MTGRPQPHDRRIHADALRRQHRGNQWARFKRQAGIMLATVALGAAVAPYATLDKDHQWAAGVYAYARGTLWIASSFSSDPAIRVRYKGTAYRLSARAVAADRYYSGSLSDAVSKACMGGLLAFTVWLSCLFLFRGAVKRRRERALQDRVIAGTVVVDEKQLARLTGAEADSRALAVGTVPIPSRLETRHLSMIGTTGSGKTTALRQMLDGIEARGEAALVYDTSGEFIAHYYRPERGDVILNPFDARCAFWSPFAEIAHPADADRIAQQFITETGQSDRDVWLETSRILVANMIRALWREGKGTLPDLLDALQDRTKDDLKLWLAGSSSARTFADDADRATGGAAR
jgi:type IV secretory pathway TraG/TraD family ATPase VirD4